MPNWTKGILTSPAIFGPIGAEREHLGDPDKGTGIYHAPSLVREIDTLLNGDGAATQASQWDVVSQMRFEVGKLEKLLSESNIPRPPFASVIGWAHAALSKGASFTFKPPSVVASVTMPAQVPDYSIKVGDTVYNKHWGDGKSPLTVIDTNWALRAAAVKLAPNGGIVVWPIAGLSKDRCE